MSSNPIVSNAPSAKPVAETGNTPQRGTPVAAEGFSLLLHAAEQPLETGLQAMLQQANVTTEPLDSSALQDMTAETGFLLGEGGWTVQSLVGQTAQMDNAVEAAVRDGSHVQQRIDSGLAAAAPQAWGRTTATLGQPPVVAQGVSPAHATAVASASLGDAAQGGTVQGAVATAAALTALTSDAVDGVSMLDTASLLGTDFNEEGRLSLQGQQWVAADKHPAAAEQLQRLMGQVAQWVAASGAADGLTARSGAARNDQGADSVGIDSSVAAMGGNSTRLTDSAVTAMVASERAGQGNADQTPASTQEMNVWTAGKQQRAEMVLDRDGQPVRVQVLVQGNEAHVTFRSDEQTTRAMLDASVAQLRDMLAAQGLELAGMQVQQHSAGAQSDGQAASQQPELFMPADARTVRMPQSDETALTPASRMVQGLDVYA